MKLLIFNNDCAEPLMKINPNFKQSTVSLQIVSIFYEYLKETEGEKNIHVVTLYNLSY